MKSTNDDELIREVQDDNKIVAGWLLWINERKEQYHLKRIEIYNSSGPCLSEAIPGNKTNVSDPTGSKIEKLSDLITAEKWINLIEDVENKLNWRKKIFLKLRREHRFCTGRKGWTAAVQYKYAHEIAKITGQKPEEVWIDSRHTFKVWWNQIVEITARLAAKRGLLDNGENNFAGDTRKAS